MRDAERIYNQLSQDGKLQMPLAETFWAKRFGMFIDRYNIPWMINCGVIPLNSQEPATGHARAGENRAAAMQAGGRRAHQWIVSVLNRR